jgi:hypothetical protein
MKSKLKFIVPILLLVAGGAYKFVLAKPGAPAPKPKPPSRTATNSCRSPRTS